MSLFPGYGIAPGLARRFNGVVERCFKSMDEWRRVAEDVRGRSFSAGHYLPGEVPELVTEELEAFLQ